MPKNLPDAKFAVIIPSYNDTEYLESCLAALFSCWAGESWTAIVVDDHSDKKHAAQVEQWAGELGFHLIRMSKRSHFTKTVNQGIIYAHSNIRPYFYFLLNSDTEVTPGWARAIMDTHYEMAAHIIGATLLYPDGKVQHAGAYGAGHHMGIEEPWTRWRKDRHVPWVTGAAIAIHKDIVSQVSMMPTDSAKTGQYDASDRNLCTAARHTKGYEVAVSAGCVIYHKTHQSREMRLEAGHITEGDTA